MDAELEEFLRLFWKLEKKFSVSQLPKNFAMFLKLKNFGVNMIFEVYLLSSNLSKLTIPRNSVDFLC